MSFSATIVAQLTPTFGQAKAREIASVADAIAVVLGESPIAMLEDHMTLPAFAAFFGFALQRARQSKVERDLRIAAGGADWPCLQDPEAALDVLKLCDAPDPDLTIDIASLQRRLDEVRKMRQQFEEDDLFESELDSEVKGH